MTTHDFTFVLDRVPLDEEIDQLFEAGCDDASPETAKGGVSLLHFGREADSLADALVSALRDVRRAGFTVTAVQSEDLVSLKDIATRTGRSYEAVRLLATGQRGPGGFPPAHQGGGLSLYSWAQVQGWLATHLRDVGQASTYDREIAAADHIVRAQRLLDQDVDRSAFGELLSAA